MKINIKPILNGETNRIKISESIALPSDFTIDEVTFTEAVKCSGFIKNYDGYINMSVIFELYFITNCARCLEPIREVMNIELDKTVSAGDTKIEGESRANVKYFDAADYFDDDYIYAENDIIDLTQSLCEHIILEIPSKFLCSEDCKGLCPKCGCNFNTDICGCEIKEIDLRLEKLKVLLQ
jgi:uncharacterized protein